MSKKKRDRTRNLLHNHPLLAKGGVHEKTAKAKRRNDKQALRKAWFSPSAWLTPCIGRSPCLLALNALMLG